MSTKLPLSQATGAVKSFLSDSLIYDFHNALGQMLAYQVNIELQEPERVLYHAVPESAYERMSRQPVFEAVAKWYTVNYQTTVNIKKRYFAKMREKTIESDDYPTFKKVFYQVD